MYSVFLSFKIDLLDFPFLMCFMHVPINVKLLTPFVHVNVFILFKRKRILPISPFKTFIGPSFLWVLPPYCSHNACRNRFSDLSTQSAICPADNLPVCCVSILPRVGNYNFHLTIAISWYSLQLNLTVTMTFATQLKDMVNSCMHQSISISATKMLV